MQPASEASHSHACLLPEKTSAKTRRSPSYLYRKGNIFYFRYAFSAQERQSFQRAEIRISLRTGFLHEAKKKARQLRAALEEFMGKNLEELNFAAAKAHLASKLKELMDSCPEKKPPTIATIRQRMDSFASECLKLLTPPFTSHSGASLLIIPPLFLLLQMILWNNLFKYFRKE